MPYRTQWTDEEISFLRDNCKILSLKEIARRLDRDYKAVKYKKFKLGLSPLTKAKKFQDYDFLQAIASSRSFKEAAIKLGYNGSSFGWSGVGNKSSLFNKMLNRLKPDLSHFTTKSKRLHRYQSCPNISIFSIYNIYKKRSKKKNREFTLSEDEFKNLCFSKCYYCGGNGNTFIPGSLTTICGIDRKDNTIGYNKDNCVACCKTCNFAKHTLNEKEFIDWIHRVSDYQRALQSSEAPDPGLEIVLA